MPGWPEYGAGEDGVIYRMLTRGGNTQSPTPVKPWVGSSGYGQVYLTRKGTRQVRQVHRVIAEAWHENPDNRPEVNHEDTNKLNCRPDNLTWSTRRENIEHAKLHNLYSVGRRNEISDADAQTAFELNLNGVNITALSKRFKVSVNKIAQVIVRLSRKV